MNAFSREEQKAATRARILEVARKHLEEAGYDATNIRGIAKAAGVATGTVLLHFRDKEDLLHTALFDDLETTWAEARQSAGRVDLEADLVALAKAFLDYYARRPTLSRALLRASLFAEPPWSARFAAQIAQVHGHIAELAMLAKARGELDAEADPALLGVAFFSFYYFALLAWSQGGHPDPLRLFRRALSQHLDGVRKRRTP